MALPTLQPFWMKHYKTPEEGFQVKRNQHQADFRNSWDETAKYFNRAEVEVSKQRDWTSPRYSSRSKEQLEKNYKRAKRKEKLEERRKKLAHLLLEESKRFQEEMRAMKVPISDRLSFMRNRVEELKSEREDKRKQDANARLYQHWRQNEPLLRQIESKQHAKKMSESWADQLSEREEKEKTARQEERRLKHVMDLRKLKEEEEEAKKRQERKERELRNAGEVRAQIEELRLKEEEAEMLKREQEMLLGQQRLIEESDEKRRKFEEQRKKQELGRILIRQHKAQLRRKSKQVQDALELDLRILEDISKKEDTEKARSTARREQAKADAEFMKKVVAEQLDLEKKREEELDMLYQEEAARQWQKRESEWERERLAREKLMKEVLAERQSQIQDKLKVVRQKQQDSIERRENLVKLMEDYQRDVEMEKDEQIRKKKEQDEEFQAQITSRQEKLDEAKRKEHLEYLKQRKEQEEYDAFLKREAQSLSARGFTERHFPRRRVAFE